MDPACSGLRVDDEELKVDGTAVNAERLSLLGCYDTSNGKTGTDILPPSSESNSP